jgi:hypothetical protein
VAASPHPRLILRRDWDLKDASHDHAVFVVLVVSDRSALEDQHLREISRPSFHPPEARRQARPIWGANLMEGPISG